MVNPATLPEPGFARLVAVMACLRAPEGGCPWDREQTLATLRAYLIEESYELLDALDDLGPAARALPADLPWPVASSESVEPKALPAPDAAAVAQFREELGDVLLQIAFQSQIAAEAGWFTADDVARGIADKMVRRHPHVFGEGNAQGDVSTPAQVTSQWEQIKRKEGKGALAGVPRHLPGLLRGQRMGEKAARIGFDWRSPADVLPKVDEELAELRAAIAGGDRDSVQEELGDLLFALTSLARHLDVDAEQALRGTLDKFSRRFAHVETQAELRHGREAQAGLDELEALWQEAKALERTPRDS